jgi:hypothetical protein
MRWGYSIKNVYGVAPRRKEVVDTTSSDQWAAACLAELAAKGIKAKLVRRSKKESLCVCYNLYDAGGEVVN